MKKAPEKLRFAALAVDVVLFQFREGQLSVLVSKIDRPPHYINMYALLGRLIDSKETAEAAASRIITEKTGLKNIPIEQLYTFSDVERDKRNRVVSVAYIGFIHPDVVIDRQDMQFAPVKNLKGLAYDHDDMVRVALQRLRGKLAYTTIAQFLLPRHFTLSELQLVYEVILQKTFDKRNFRKKILALTIVRDTGRMQEGVKNRPAALYEFTSQKLQELPLLA